MGNFRPSGRDGFDRGSRSGGSRFGGRGGFGRSDRGPAQMHDATCSKCGKACQVPFKPTGSKPVLCSDCFRNDGGNSRSFDNSSSGSSGSSEQFKQINAKLDKIIQVLDQLEIIQEDNAEEDSEDDSEKDL